jgi:phage regulator Rha-like protein
MLQKIDNLECPKLFGRPNFRPTTYIDGHGRKQRMVKVFRDGFVFLTGKFTGTKAAAYTEAYIAMFNRYEAMVLSQPNPEQALLTAPRSELIRQIADTAERAEAAEAKERTATDRARDAEGVIVRAAKVVGVLQPKAEAFDRLIDSD